MASTVMALASVGLLSVLFAGGTAVGQAASAAQRASAAADAAALAAADTLVGTAADDPCGVARRVAEANGADLEACELDGLIAMVSVRVEVVGLSVRAQARAAVPVPVGGDHGGFGNGRLPVEVLTPIPWQPELRLRADAAASLMALNAAYRADFGTDLPLSDAYRDLAGQEVEREQWCARGNCAFAALPGSSNHGWATAIDVGIARTAWDDPTYVWLCSHAARFGWSHPPWAEPDGATPEAWHWEFG